MNIDSDGDALNYHLALIWNWVRRSLNGRDIPFPSKRVKLFIVCTSGYPIFGNPIAYRYGV